MTIRLNGALRRCLAGWALGGLIAIPFVPTATAQWLPPWRAVFPGDIARGLEAEGYVLTGPLMRRPGIYLADVSAGPGNYQRLVIDARNGQILERFTVPDRPFAPMLAARDERFGAPPAMGAPPLSGELSGPSGPAALAPKPSYGGRGSVHIPAAVSPYGPGQTPGGAKPKAKSILTERKPVTTKPIDPPLPPAAPREAAKADESGFSGQGRSDSSPTDGDRAAQGVSGSSLEAPDDKPKVSIVPPALFQ